MTNYSVKEMLENYKKLRAKTNMLNGKGIPDDLKMELEQLKVSLDNLDTCIEGLPQEEAELIKLYFIDGVIGRRLSNRTCMSRATLYRKRIKAIEDIEANFIKFSKN